MRRNTGAVVWLVLVLGACGADRARGDADAGADVDAGADADAGAEADAGVDVNADAGVDADAGGSVDAGEDADGSGLVAVPGWFDQVMAWDQPVLNLAPAAASGPIIADLVERGGWGNGGVFQIDFSIEVLEATAGTPLVSWTPNGDWYETECDAAPVPVPAGGALEGEAGYACEGDGDCHLIVHDTATRTLYEMWRADFAGAPTGGCLAVWHLDRAYDETLRGDQCTSADAAGLPIAPLLFTADEVAAGEVRHAIRFILPNSRIRNRTYVRPATHATGVASGGADSAPYGVRLRLRADFPVASLPSEGARVVARALQRYGMILTDGGQIALTARSDRFGTASWDGLLGPHDLAALAVTDFDVVDLGATHHWDGDCVRSD